MTLTRNKTKSRRKQLKDAGHEGVMKRMFNGLSKIGKALLVPIAVMPLAAIFLRLGAQIPATTAFSSFIGSVMLQAGNAVFSNLPILFAVGVAFGITKDRRGEAALAGLVGMIMVKLLMASSGADLTEKIYGHLHLASGTAALGFHPVFGSKYDAVLSENVINGIVSGLFVGFLYNHFHDVELPKLLGFFGGRRLITVLTIGSLIILGILWAIVFPWIGYVLYLFSNALGDATGNRWSNAAIMGVYGVINRLLIPFGLHQVPNALFWFQLGDFQTAAGGIVNGDINGFLSGAAQWTDAAGNTVLNNAGTFQSGFFPIMMFGLPALVAAMWVTADDKEQRNKVVALMGGAAIISFLTGITEPIEYAFLFAAPALFGIHALLTGLFAFITGLFGIQIGFGFSAGLIDYGLSLPKSMDIIAAKEAHASLAGGMTHIQAVMANPGWIFPIGAVTGASYFFIGKFAIRKFNIATPGRGENQITNEAIEEAKGGATSAGTMKPQSAKIVKALGGWDNITDYGNCTTRLRYDVKDSSIVDEKALKNAGAMGLVRASKTHVQVIIGTHVESVNADIVKHKGQDISVVLGGASASAAAPAKAAVKAKSVSVKSVGTGTVKTLASLKDGVFSKKMMGDGVVVASAASATKATYYAPVSGELVTVFPTGHAYGIRTAEGVEVLLHIGVDTVKLDGKGFKSLVKQGAKVKAGDAMVDVDLKYVRAHAPSADAVVLVTSGQAVTNKATGKVTKTSKLFTTK